METVLFMSIDGEIHSYDTTLSEVGMFMTTHWFPTAHHKISSATRRNPPTVRMPEVNDDGSSCTWRKGESDKVRWSPCSSAVLVKDHSLSTNWVLADHTV